MGQYGLREVERIISAATKAARIVTDSALTEHEVNEEKGKGNFVTKYDVAVQEYLIRALSAAFPEASFFAEEKKDNLLTDAPTFIIDPIDGTANFVFGLRHSGISIALCVEKKAVLAVVINPYSDEVFYAVRGEGAYLRARGTDRRLSVMDASLSETPVLVGTDPYRKNETGAITAALLAHTLKHGMDVRRFGAACLDLAYVAAGRAGLFFELRLSPWDYAAGLLLVEEAGGTVTDLQGNELCFTPSSVLAGCAKAHAEFKRVVLPAAMAEAKKLI